MVEKRNRGKKAVDNSGSVANYKPHQSLLIRLNEDEDSRTWYGYGKNLQGRNSTIATDPPKHGEKSNLELVQKYRSLADTIYAKEVQLFGKESGVSKSDQRWIENAMRKGTLKDRIAAMSVTVSTDPVHKFYALDGLLQMAGCSDTGGQTNSRVAQLTAEAMEDLFMNTFLPPDRKLYRLNQRPLYRYETGKHSLSPKVLLLWRFEEMVKDKYEMFLSKYLSKTLQDGVEMQKVAALRSAAALLRSVPEGESQLLTMMVNKIGDPMKKTSAAAAHELRRVLQVHPAMQVVIAREVQQLAHRPQLSSRALYNCIVFLNQLKLKKEEPTAGKQTLPTSLITTYFRLFEVAVQKPKAKAKDSSGEEGMKSRLLSALLTGVNRAHPYLPEKDKDLEQHVDALYKVVHTAPPSASTQALMLLFNLAVGSTHEETTETTHRMNEKGDEARQNRFYRALYSTLSQSHVDSGKHSTMYFNLLYKSIKYDTDENRVNSICKRLLCTAMHCSPSVISASLFLVNELAKSHSSLKDSFEATPKEEDSRLILDASKREPSAALVVKGEKEENNDTVKTPPLWELTMIANHFHPSVSKFANDMGDIAYDGDPLKDFGLAPFLDKFAYRNPKSSQKLADRYKRGESVAERRSGNEGRIQALISLPVNDPEFLEQEKVNEQDEFFHKFFVERARRDKIKGIVRNKPNQTEDDEEDALDDAMDAAEGSTGIDVGKTFEDYERAWEVDEEEEAFVDKLALSLMEDAEDAEIHGLDDEDPDMEGWDDMYDNEEDGESGEEPDIPDDDDESTDNGDFAGDNDDEDAFMDDEGDDSDSVGNLDAGNDIEGDFDEDDEGDLVFMDSDQSDGDDVSETETKPSKKRKKDMPAFADASDYEEMIEKSFNELQSNINSSDNGNESTEPAEKSSQKKKHKKKKAGKKRET